MGPPSRWIVPFALALVTCHKREEEPEADPICGRPVDLAGTPIAGDATGDGQVDVSDGVWLARRELSGGPDPACGPCVDIAGQGRYSDVGHAGAVWYWLFSGTTEKLPDVPDGTVLVDPGVAPVCADSVALAFEKAGTTSVAVTLRTDGVGAEAWSFGVKAEGCTIAAATTLGTVAADAIDGGLRTRGFDRTDAAGATATSAVVLSWRDPVTLPEGSAQRIALLELTPGETCDCELQFTGDAVGKGQPVALAVSSAGWTLPPETTSLKTSVCP